MFYGIDLSKESFKAALLKKDSDELRMISCPLHGEAFTTFKAQLTDEDYVAVEASTNTFWFVEQIRDLVKECFVLDPYKLSIIYRSTKKTDKTDAQKIAHKLKYHILYDQSGSEFPSIFIPSKEIQELRSLLSTYEMLKKELIMTKNRIRSILTQNGFFGLKSKDISLQKNQQYISGLSLSSVVQGQLTVLFQMLNMQEESIKRIKETAVINSTSFQREVDILTSVKGISPFIAVVLLADIADIHRFKNAKHFCSYLRAAPKIDASGDSTKIGRTNKHSRRSTMSVLVECINHFRSSSPRLNAFYERKAVGKSRGKVRVAVVRKVLVSIFHMLSRKEYFRDMDIQNHENKMKEYEKIIKKAA
jgi:transposase